MQTPLINSILMGIVALTSFTVIGYWHVTTRGTWKDWPAGRSLMGLLSIIGIAFSYGVVNSLMGPQGYAAKPYISFVLYLAFGIALVIIGLTIRHEIVKGREHPDPVKPITGTIEITIATDKDQSND